LPGRTTSTTTSQPATTVLSQLSRTAAIGEASWSCSDRANPENPNCGLLSRTRTEVDSTG
jgi:hypothetical protein